MDIGFYDYQYMTFNLTELTAVKKWGWLLLYELNNYTIKSALVI